MGWAGGVRALAVFARRTSKTARAYAYSMAVRVSTWVQFCRGVVRKSGSHEIMRLN